MLKRVTVGFLVFLLFISNIVTLVKYIHSEDNYKRVTENILVDTYSVLSGLIYRLEQSNLDINKGQDRTSNMLYALRYIDEMAKLGSIDKAYVSKDKDSIFPYRLIYFNVGSIVRDVYDKDISGIVRDNKDREKIDKLISFLRLVQENYIENDQYLKYNGAKLVEINNRIVNDVFSDYDMRSNLNIK